MNSTTFIFTLMIIWLTLITIGIVWSLKFRADEIKQEYIAISWLEDRAKESDREVIKTIIKEWKKLNK